MSGSGQDSKIFWAVVTRFRYEGFNSKSLGEIVKTTRSCKNNIDKCTYVPLSLEQFLDAGFCD